MDFEMLVSDPSTPSGAITTEEQILLLRWFTSIGFPDYAPIFIQEGFDFELICSQGINEDDLIAMGIVKRGHIKKIVAAVEEIKNPLSKQKFLAHYEQRGGKSEGKTPDMTEASSENSSLSTIKDLYDFSARFMSSTVDQERACTYLEAAIKYGDETLKALCLDFIERNTLSVLSSTDFLKISPSNLEYILQSPRLDIDELILLQALLRWKSAGPNRDLSSFAKYIRFGAIPADSLFQIVEPSKIATEEQLLTAYRFHALGGRLGANTPFFSRRKNPSLPQPLSLLVGTGPNTSTGFANAFPIPAKGAVWKLSMSTSYAGLPNNYDTLVDDRPCFPGCATNYGANQWVQASFSQPAIVNKIRLSAPNQGEFTSQGWGDSYLHGIEIQFSNDEKTWESVATVQKVNTTGFTDIEIGGKIGQYWRLFKPHNYIATGSFILE